MDAAVDWTRAPSGGDRARRAATAGLVVRVLGQVVDGLAPRVSRSRVEQLRMVVGMWGRALEQWPADGPGRPASAAGVFEPAVLEVFWRLADDGALRTVHVGRPLSTSTRHVVRVCMQILGEQLVPGLAVWAPPIAWPVLHSPVGEGQLVVLYRSLVDVAADAPVQIGQVGLSVEDRVRLLAMVAVVLDTGAHSGELESMRVPDLGDAASSVWVRRRPQNGTHLPQVDEQCPLREGTGVAVRRWLHVRQRLVAGMEGGPVEALWVSLRPNQHQERAGFPLRAQGIRLAYRRGVLALNEVMAGRAGWEPLPTTLERLRRAVAPGVGPVEVGTCRAPG